MALSDKIGEATSLLNGYVMEKHTTNAQNPNNAPKTADKAHKAFKRGCGNGKGTTETTRRFNIRTYIKPDIVDRFLKTAPWVQYWAYCYHDKDVYEDGSSKEPHTHILLYTYHQKTSSAMLGRYG